MLSNHLWNELRYCISEIPVLRRLRQGDHHEPRTGWAPWHPAPGQPTPPPQPDNRLQCLESWMDLMRRCLENARNTEEKCPDTHCPLLLSFTTQSALSSCGWFYVCWWTNALTCVGVQTSWSQFSPSTTWVLGTEFRSSGLAASTLTCWATSPTR